MVAITHIVSGTDRTLKDRVQRARQAHFVLGGLLILVSIYSLTVGATSVELLPSLLKLITGQELSAIERIVLWDIRLPRLFEAIMVGGALAVSGAVLQGLFRNPLADPGLIGVNAGASLGAITAIVMVAFFPPIILNLAGDYLVMACAFGGAWISILLLYTIATRGGRTSVATMLLGGIAIAALSMAVSGLMIFRADDQQLRDLTFWNLGSLAGASWPKVVGTAPIILAALALAVRLGRGLNGLALGEATAMHIGVPVERTKNIAILSVAAAVGAAVAVSGGIGFIGIVVPHILRLVTGPDHRPLLINAGLFGAILLIISDMIARTIVAPAELPIGIVTAILGSPVFLWILLRRRSLVDL